MAKRKTTTSTEVKERWNAKTYKRIVIQLRKDYDVDYLEALEELRKEYSPTQIFKYGIDALKGIK